VGVDNLLIQDRRPSIFIKGLQERFVTTKIEEILKKSPLDWSDDEWSTFKQSMINGEVIAAKIANIPLPWSRGKGLGWPKSGQSDFDGEIDRCAIRRFFKENPDATSVMMVCNCRLCTPYYLSTAP